MTATQCARFIFINGKEKKKGFKFALPWGVNCALQKTVWSILISGLICCRAMSLRTKRKRECKLSNKTFYVTRERSAKKCVKCQIFDLFFTSNTTAKCPEYKIENLCTNYKDVVDHKEKTSAKLLLFVIKTE